MVQTTQPPGKKAPKPPKPPNSKSRKQSTAKGDPDASRKKTNVSGKKSAETRPGKIVIPKPPRFQPDLDTGYGIPGPEDQSLAVLRTLRRRKLVQQTPLERQVSRGRPDTGKNWCGKEYCLSEKAIFDVHVYCFADQKLSSRRLLVADYHRDFASAMVDALFPEVRPMGFAARAAKLRAVWSFVESPPIRACLWRCKKLCRNNGILPGAEDLQAALMAAQPVFQDAMFGARTEGRVGLVHDYLDMSEDALNQPRDLRFLLLQFLFSAELFRRHETCRSAAWDLGSPEQVGQFLTALAFHYWTMIWEGCFWERWVVFAEDWDCVWDEWFDEFPVSSSSAKLAGRDFIVRDEHEGTEQDFLQHVGYLGGIGRCDEFHRPTRRWKKNMR